MGKIPLYREESHFSDDHFAGLCEIRTCIFQVNYNLSRIVRISFFIYVVSYEHQFQEILTAKF